MIWMEVVFWETLQQQQNRCLMRTCNYINLFKKNTSLTLDNLRRGKKIFNLHLICGKKKSLNPNSLFFRSSVITNHMKKLIASHILGWPLIWPS